MSTELTADTLIPLSIQERKALILHHTSLIDVINITDEDLHNAYKLGKIIVSISSEYFQYQIEQDNLKGSVLELEAQSSLIRSKTDKFAENLSRG